MTDDQREANSEDPQGARDTRAQAKRLPSRSQEGREGQALNFRQREEVASQTAPDHSGGCSATRTRLGSPEDA